MSSIKLSPKHGLNPTIPTCFWCGNQKNEVALLGRMKDDAEAPMTCILDLEPCDTCQANMALGITLIEAHQGGKASEPQIQPGVWPSGRWVVITEDACKRIFDPEMAEACLKHRKAFIEPAAFAMFVQDPQPEG
jgi:hypothetical protein